MLQHQPDGSSRCRSDGAAPVRVPISTICSALIGRGDQTVKYLVEIRAAESQRGSAQNLVRVDRSGSAGWQPRHCCRGRRTGQVCRRAARRFPRRFRSRYRAGNERVHSRGRIWQTPWRASHAGRPRALVKARVPRPEAPPSTLWRLGAVFGNQCLVLADSAEESKWKEARAVQRVIQLDLTLGLLGQGIFICIGRICRGGPDFAKRSNRITTTTWPSRICLVMVLLEASRRAQNSKLTAASSRTTPFSQCGLRVRPGL